MRLKRTVLVTSASLAFSAALVAAAPCDSSLSASLHECERIVGSLLPDKAGQMRVFAADGSVFTAGQAMWMKEQLKLAEQACSQGDAAGASRRVTDVQQLLSEHRPSA